MILVLLTGAVNAADYVLTITIPEAQVQRVANAFVTLYPIPLDEETGEPLYGVAQWVRMKMVDHIKRVVTRVEKQAARQAADATIDASGVVSE